MVEKAWYGGLHGNVLRLIGHKAQISKYPGQQRGADGHAHFVSQGDKGILESVIANAGFPFAVFHTVGNNGVNGGIEAAEKELGQGGQTVEGNGAGSCTEEVHGKHGGTGTRGKHRSSTALVAQPAEHKGEDACAQNGRDHQKHGVYGEQAFVPLHVLKVVQQVCISSI